MRTREIPRTAWRPVFDALSRSYDGAMVSVEINDDRIGAQKEGENRPLRGISADDTGISVFLGGGPQRHLDHRITNPRKVWFAEAEEGALVAIEVEDGSDTRTIVRFRSPMRADLLDRGVE
jgi:hypothetical protein